MSQTKTLRGFAMLGVMQPHLPMKVSALAAISVLAFGLMGCSNEPDERHWIDAQEARDGSIEALKLIHELVPSEAIDETQSRLGPGEDDIEPEICEGIDPGNGGPVMYYPGEVLLPLAQHIDPAALIDGLVNELHVEHGWRLATNLAVTTEPDDIDQGMVTDEDYMVALRTVDAEDNSPQLEISAWSPCYNVVAR